MQIDIYQVSDFFWVCVLKAFILGKISAAKNAGVFTLNCKTSFSCLCDCLSVITVVFFRPYVS